MISSKTKLGLTVLVAVGGIMTLSHFLNPHTENVLGVKINKTFHFDFGNLPAGRQGIEQVDNNPALAKIVEADLKDQPGFYAVVIEKLPPATPSASWKEEQYQLNEKAYFPAASLYKLVLLAAVLKEVENHTLKLDDILVSSKSHLIAVLGSVDYGYEDIKGDIKYSVAEALKRVGEISDNFAAIMLTEKLRQACNNQPCKANEDPLVQMAKELGMDETSFTGLPNTSASDIAVYFKLLYQGKVVSQDASDKIMGFLSGSKINDRIPAQIPDDIKIIHKTGELAELRHDAGIIYLEKNPYLIVLMSKDLQYEDDGVNVLAQISKDVFDYFQNKVK